MKKILIAEDNELNMKLMTDILEFEGFNITQASDGQEALDMIEQEDFDLILLDIQMPVKSGYDVMAQMKKDIPVVVVSAFASKQEIDKMREFNPLAYITKPIMIKSFVKTVKSALGG